MLESFKQWYAEPFRTNMDVGQWFLFLGLLVVLTIVWQIIFLHISRAIRD